MIGAVTYIPEDFLKEIVEMGWWAKNAMQPVGNRGRKEESYIFGDKRNEERKIVLGLGWGRWKASRGGSGWSSVSGGTWTLV